MAVLPHIGATADPSVPIPLPAAMSFYEAIGYVEVGRESRPDWRWTLVYYLKRLPSSPPS
jgi:predicted GNAT superfamily acetyltransferase